MVLTSLPLMARFRSVNPDRFWKRRKILRMSAHFYGRRKNCYTIAIRSVQRAWQYMTTARKLKKEEMKKLWITRLEAGCQQHGITYEALKNGLDRLDIFLNKKILSDLAVWEPRTFKSLADLSMATVKEEGLNGINSLKDSAPPEGVFPRSMLKLK